MNSGRIRVTERFSFRNFWQILTDRHTCNMCEDDAQDIIVMLGPSAKLLIELGILQDALITMGFERINLVTLSYDRADCSEEIGVSISIMQPSVVEISNCINRFTPIKINTTTEHWQELVITSVQQLINRFSKEQIF